MTDSDFHERIQNWQEYAENSLVNPCFRQGLSVPSKHWKCERKTIVPDAYYARVQFPDKLRFHGCATSQTPVCDIGDSVIVNALLGWSGDVRGFEAVKASQDANGRWWRSPLHELHTSSSTSFSKDHTLGVLLYLAANPDKGLSRSQAQKWLHYISSNGRLFEKLRIGPDIPEEIGYKFARSLYECRDGLSSDGCVVREAEEVVVDVWEKIKSGAECLRDFSSCWEKSKKRVIKAVDREIGYWTANVCPEPSAGHCTITPGLWFLFHRVWTDHLGLAPSSSMTFAYNLFLQSDETYDRFVAWEASNNDGFKLHLSAVNGLIRALLGKPADLTISEVYRKGRDNPFYQILMNRFVDSSIHSADDVKAHLLSIAPAEISVEERETYADDYKDNRKVEIVVRGKIGSESIEISGRQWAWERDDVRTSVRDTMGWDCLFIANLLVQEFQVELDYYLRHVLPGMLSHRKRSLDRAYSDLTDAIRELEAYEADIDEFVDQAVTLIELPEVTFEELNGLKELIKKRHDAMCPLDTRQLSDSYRSTREGYDTLLRLKADSRRRFQDALRVAEFQEFWEEHLSPYSNLDVTLQNVWTRLSSTSACLRLVKLLAAIPLRIEQEKIDGTNEDLRRVSDQVVASLKSIAIAREHDRISNELAVYAHSLSQQLRRNRVKRKFERARHAAEEIENGFQVKYERLRAESSLLSDTELSEIREESISIINKEKQLWDDFVDEIGVANIVKSRLGLMNSAIRRQFAIVQSYPIGHRRALYYQWLKGTSDAGYVTPIECRLGDATQESSIAGENVFDHLRCWEIWEPSGTEDVEDWTRFDLILNGLEDFLSDFGRIDLQVQIAYANGDLRDFPAVRVLFDVEEGGTCKETIPDPVRYRRCTIPDLMDFRASPVSSSQGNGVIESLTYFNRFVIFDSVESFYDSAVTWAINGYGGETEVDTVVPVSYQGSVLRLETYGMEEWNVFKPGSRVEVLVNYMYPDTDGLSLYSRMLGRYSGSLADIYSDLGPGSTQLEVIASLDEGIQLFDLLLGRDDLDAITRRQIEMAKARLEDGLQSVTQACDEGGPRLCAEEIRRVREAISTDLREVRSELATLREFLEAEVERLSSIADSSIRRRLEEILEDVNRYGDFADKRRGGALGRVLGGKVLASAGIEARRKEDQRRFIQGERVDFSLSEQLFADSRIEQGRNWRCLVCPHTYRAFPRDFPFAGTYVNNSTTSPPPQYLGIQGPINRSEGSAGGPVFGMDGERNLKHLVLDMDFLLIDEELMATLPKKEIQLQAWVEFSVIPEYDVMGTAYSFDLYVTGDARKWGLNDHLNGYGARTDTAFLDGRIRKETLERFRRLWLHFTLLGGHLQIHSVTCQLLTPW